MSPQECSFEGSVQSKSLNGAAAITVAKDALLFDAPLDQLTCFYPDIYAFALKDYRLVIETAAGQVRVSMMGDALNWLFSALWDAYNDAVQRALLVDGAPLYESRGEYCYEDSGGSSEGTAVVRLFDNCVCVFPPDEGARRIPFCFLESMKEENYCLRLTLDTGEWYSFNKLGGYKEGFVYQLTQALQAQLKKTQQSLQEICGGMDSAELTATARLMREGVAAPISALGAISPACVGSIQALIAQSRAAQPYAFFKTLCDPDHLCVGIKKAERDTAGAPEEAGSPESEQDAEAPAEEPAAPATVFIVASKPEAAGSGGVAAVELAVPQESFAATFIYRYQGEWAAFWRKLNHAMEAISFKREVIWLDTEALNKPENRHYRMALARVEALRFLRSCFVGRVIHNSPEAWGKAIEQKLNQ